jgi:hypothetical protein
MSLMTSEGPFTAPLATVASVLRVRFDSRISIPKMESSKFLHNSLFIAHGYDVYYRVHSPLTIWSEYVALDMMYNQIQQSRQVGSRGEPQTRHLGGNAEPFQHLWDIYWTRVARS